MLTQRMRDHGPEQGALGAVLLHHAAPQRGVVITGIRGARCVGTPPKRLVHVAERRGRVLGPELVRGVRFEARERGGHGLFCWPSASPEKQQPQC